MVDLSRYIQSYEPQTRDNNQGVPTYGQTSRQSGTPYFSWENNQPTQQPTGEPTVGAGSSKDYVNKYGNAEDLDNADDPYLVKNKQFVNDLITSLLGESPIAKSLMDYITGSMTPEAQRGVGRLEEQEGRIGNMKPFYSPEEEGKIGGMITGEAFTPGVATNMRGQITRSMEPGRDSLRKILATTGQMNNPDAISSAVMNVADESNRTFQDLSTKYMMDMMNTGVSARQTGEAATMDRERLRTNINEFIPTFTEEAKKGRMDTGMNLETLNQNKLQNLINLLSQIQTNKSKQGNEWISAAITGASNPALWAGA